MNTDFLIGGFSGIISRTLTAPLELWKMQQQNFFIPNTTFRDVLQKEGFRYLWKGNLTNCIRIFPQYSINFATYQFCNQQLTPYIDNKHIRNLTSGSFAGMIAMTGVYPLETIRSRLALQTKHSHYSGMFNAFMKMSFREKYSGLRMSLFGFTPYNGLNFAFFHYYKSIIEKFISNKEYVNLFAGGLAGMSAVSYTYPTDLVRRRLQLQGFDKTVPKYNGILHCFSQIYKLEGMQGLYRGLSACYIKIFPSVAIQFWCFEKGKELFSKEI